MGYAPDSRPQDEAVKFNGASTMFQLGLYKELFHFGHPVSGGDEVVLRGLLLQQLRDKGQLRWGE